MFLVTIIGIESWFSKRCAKCNKFADDYCDSCLTNQLLVTYKLTLLLRRHDQLVAAVAYDDVAADLVGVSAAVLDAIGTRRPGVYKTLESHLVSTRALLTLRPASEQDKFIISSLHPIHYCCPTLALDVPTR